jgi:hypothetical protein
MLKKKAPQPENPSWRLTLPTVEDVKGVADAAQVEVFTRRRATLFDIFLGLRDRISHLGDYDFCRYRLLSALFGEGSTAVSECWDQVFVIRGENALPGYNEAVDAVIASGCVQVHMP